MGVDVSNHSYVDLTLVGDARNGSDSVQCHTDLVTCCSNAAAGPDRGDWYFPNGTRLPFSDIIFESRQAQRVDLRHRGGSDVTSGVYRCTVETNAFNDDDGHETVYAGLYASGGEEDMRCSSTEYHTLTLCSAGDVSTPGGVTFSMKSDLNGEGPQFTLTCISTGGPATTVTWTRNSEAVSGGMTVLDDPVTAQYTHTLTVTGKMGGQYQCNVSNSKPSQSSASFTVKGTLNKNCYEYCV